MTLDQGSVAFILSQAALLNCRVAGMQAENQHRLSLGFSVAYTGEDFRSIEQEFESTIGYNVIMKMAQGI